MKHKGLRCPECDRGALVDGIAELKGNTHGETFNIRIDALICSKCGFKTLRKEKMGEFALRVADAYRQKHGLLTSSEIRDRRAALGMTQQQFANYLSVGVASVKRWELGNIQDPAMNNLMMLKTDPAAAEQNMIDVSARLGRPAWNRRDIMSDFDQMFVIDDFQAGLHGKCKIFWEPKDIPKAPMRFGTLRGPISVHCVLSEEQLREFENAGASMQMLEVA